MWLGESASFPSGPARAIVHGATGVNFTCAALIITAGNPCENPYPTPIRPLCVTVFCCRYKAIFRIGLCTWKVERRNIGQALSGGLEVMSLTWPAGLVAIHGHDVITYWT